MLLSIIKNDGSAKTITTGNEVDLIDEALSESIRIKVKFVTLMMKMFKTVREERELILKLKGCCPGNKIPRGLILQGPNALKGAYERYNKAKVFDIVNEKRPTEQDQTNVNSKEYLDD